MTTNQQDEAIAASADGKIELRLHQCIKDAWKLVNTTFASDSAKSKVGAVVVAPIGEVSRKQLIFALRSAWTFIHGSGGQLPRPKG